MPIETLYLNDDELALLSRLIGHCPISLYAQSIAVNRDGTIDTNLDGWFSLRFPEPGTQGRQTAFLCLANSLRDMAGMSDVPRFQIELNRTGNDLPVDPDTTDGLTFTSLNYSEVKVSYANLTAIEIYESDKTSGENGVRFDCCLRFWLDDGDSFVFAIDTSIVCNVHFACRPEAIAELLLGTSLRKTLGVLPGG